MPQYVLRYEIELEADNPAAAALHLWEIMRDEGSLPPVLDVYADPTSKAHVRVDCEQIAACQNCECVWQDKELQPIRDLLQRVSPGERMPAGQCPACGALCHRPDLFDGEL